MSGAKKAQAPAKSKAAPVKSHSESEEESEDESEVESSSEEEQSDDSSEEESSEEESSEEESDDESESESEDEKPVKKATKSAFAMLNASDDDESEEESDDESEEESDDEPVQKKQSKAKPAASKPAPVKKGKALKGKKNDDDLDALLADIEAKPAAAKKAAAAKPAAAKPAAAVAANGEEAAPGLSKAAQKRLKQQQKAEADKKAAEEKAAKAAAEPVKEEKKTAGPPKKQSKDVLALREALKRQKDEEQRRIQEAEAIRLAEEAEARQLAEEEQKRKEASERRSHDRAEKREQLKKEGKLLTKADKEKALKAQQFIEQLKAQGLPIPEPKAEKKVKYGGKDKKEKKPKKADAVPASADTQVEEVTAAVADVSISTPSAAAPVARTKVSKGGKSSKADKKSAQAAADAQRIRDAAAAEAETKKLAEEVEAKRLAADAAAAEAAALIAETEEVEVEESEDEMSESEITVDDDEIVDSWAMDEDELQEAKEIKLNEKKAALRDQRVARQAAREEKRAALVAKKAAAAKAAAELAAKAAAISAAAEKEAAVAKAAAEKESAVSAEGSSPSNAAGSSSPDGKSAKGSKSKDKDTNRELRSPICCILGHVDTGKTKLLDKIRQSNVQEGEAGGITQQIGATYFPADAIRTKTAEISKMMKNELEIRVPGLLVIDTPGHESFTNLRSRGSGLCDIAVLVVDIMHGLEPQTLESIGLLKMRKTPFVVALNKIDRCYDWVASPNAPFRQTLEKQKGHVKDEFEKRSDEALMALTEQGLNVALYWKNPDVRSYVNVIPTSAVTGEGIPDLLMTLVRLTQSMMNERLSYIAELQSTVLEVKMVEGLGTTIDVILVNGVLNEGDTIVVSGLNGPIVTTIRALLTPPHMAELRIKSEYIHHKSVKAAMGVKISAQGLEHAIAGSQLLVYKQGRGPSLEDLKDEVQGDLATILSKVDKSGQGVCVQASTLGSLEALLTFLDEMKIPVMGINIGPVHKKDIMKASIMLERKPEYAVILAFDVKVVSDAEKLAAELGVTIFTADIIYHLYDKVTNYMAKIKEERRAASAGVAVFPLVLDIMPNCVFNAKNPLVLGCRVVEGLARLGTPLCVPVRDKLFIGRITSMEKNHEQVTDGRKGDELAIKIEMDKGGPNIIVGRQFEATDQLVSKLSRESITLLKENFKDDLNQEEWKCVVKLKKILEIV